jgi:transposase
MEDIMMDQINLHAGAVDVGSELLYTAVHGGPVQVFKTFTADLHKLVEFFAVHKVTTVAMEATGVYWLVAYELLTEAGMAVCVVNGAHVKNLPGRKSDLSDCQWLAQLHAHGLLRGGFVPPEAVRRLRDYQRLREDHVQMGSAHILHMQKALDRMNVKLHEVLSQTTGSSSLRVIRAILEGEREPEKLVELCDVQILARKREAVIESLRGCWKAEHLFALQQALQGWEFYQRQIQACDQQIAQALEQIQPAQPPPPPPARPESGVKESKSRKAPKKIHHHAPEIGQLHQTLLRLCGGQDATLLPTLTDYSVLQILAEVGTDMARWKTEKHFTSWLGLAPASRQSGKSRKPEKRFRGRAGRLFCVAARSLARSKHLALGGFYRRVRATRGGQVANIAAARKVAQLFYRTLRYGLNYVETGLAQYEAQYRAQSIKRLQTAASHFGLNVVAA